MEPIINKDMEFRWIPAGQPPEEDGRYLVTWLEARELWAMDYTVEHGWNTSPESHKHRLDDGCVKAWSKFPAPYRGE